MSLSRAARAVAALLLSANFARALAGEKTEIPPGTLTPEQIQLMADYGGQIGGIPPEFRTNYATLEQYISGRSQDFGDLSTNPSFHQSVAKLLGIRSESQDRAGNGGVIPPTSPGRTGYEEQYYRGLQGGLPREYWVHREAGKYAYDRKDYRTALKDYEEAVRLNPRDTKSWLGYGLSATELGDFALGNKAANQILDYEPKNRDALGLRAFSTGRRSTANLPSSLFDPASDGGPGQLALAPSGPSAGASGGRYAASAGMPAVRAVDRAAVDRSAQLTREAAAAIRVRDFAVAHQFASRAVQANPENAQAFNFRAIASNKLSRYQDAVVDASAALALGPGNATALQTRSSAFAKLKQYKEALADANATVEADPNNAFAYQNRAHAQAGLGDRESSIDSLRRSAALDARFQTRLERALQLPQDQDLTLLFDDESSANATATPAPGTAKKRFARLALLSASGGLLIALGVLHVVSASWREKVRMTIRRALASPGEEEGAVASSSPLPTGGAFWTQYELSREIGLGGMGVVYEATDRALERRVAVKKMRDEIRLDPHERQRFVNEARVVAQLRHANIVDIYGIVEEGQDVYLVFEFVEGKTLHDILRSSGPLDLTNARGVLKLMCDAVEHAHAKKVIHRDIKPSNVMITTDGRVKVMDFGIARQAKEAVTKMSMTNTIAGTPPYMAPEQEQGTVRRESDVYALGVCFYEMITGQLPFTGTGAAMLLNKLNGKYILPTQRNPALPQALDVVMAAALHPDPDKRYHTPSDLIAAVDAAAAAARA